MWTSRATWPSRSLSSDRLGRPLGRLPDSQLRGYTRFILPPTEIWIDKDAEYRGLSADVVQDIAAIYQSSFQRALAPEFTVG